MNTTTAVGVRNWYFDFCCVHSHL